MNVFVLLAFSPKEKLNQKKGNQIYPDLFSKTKKTKSYTDILRKAFGWR